MKCIVFVFLNLIAIAHICAASLEPVFNRAPLATKQYAELPLGAIRPEGWLRDELQRMADGMSGHLDEWYPEVCGPRNAWLGGDGDNWERGPYWIDGLYPLAKLLSNKQLEAKAMRWVAYTIDHQRDDGYIGPRQSGDHRTISPPEGAQIEKPDDWWPRMVMLKVLQQHAFATGDQRTLDCLRRYFQYQLHTLPIAPLHDPSNPRSGSWWATQRGGDNLLVVLWLYNVTGDKSLLELAKLVSAQTVPTSDWFLPGPKNLLIYAADQGHPALHGVNLAQMMKTPVVRWQLDRDPRHLEAIDSAFNLIRAFHGQPYGMYGADESLHGREPTRGSELCSAVELMFSLETMLEITGDPRNADRLERIAFNALPTQATNDFRARQYFQQANQVLVTHASRDFFDDGGDRIVYGLLTGYVCCTCNMHQGWPKFAQHLWYATSDHGIAALAYAPSSVTAQVANGPSVTLRQSGGYPFEPQVEISIQTDRDVEFPLHLRIPGWCHEPRIEVNGTAIDDTLAPATIHVIRRKWHNGDHIVLHTPMTLRSERWFNRSCTIERGPLVYALDIPFETHDVVQPRPEGVSASAMHRGYIEYKPQADWNFGIPERTLADLNGRVKLESSNTIAGNPWVAKNSPVRLTLDGVRLPQWQLCRDSAANPPMSPVDVPADADVRPIHLIPYGATVLRITEFPTVRGEKPAQP